MKILLFILISFNWILTFSQNKKEIIERLTIQKDSLNSVLFNCHLESIGFSENKIVLENKLSGLTKELTSLQSEISRLRNLNVLLVDSIIFLNSHDFAFRRLSDSLFSNNIEFDTYWADLLYSLPNKTDKEIKKYSCFEDTILHIDNGFINCESEPTYYSFEYDKSDKLICKITRTGYTELTFEYVYYDYYGRPFMQLERSVYHGESELVKTDYFNSKGLIVHSK